MNTPIKENVKSKNKQTDPKHSGHLGHYEKTKSQYNTNRGREKNQAEGTENIFNDVGLRAEQGRNK